MTLGLPTNCVNSPPSSRITLQVLYPKCEMGVFPPSGFDPRLADRSRVLPEAHMWLEHIYGYAGTDIQASNIFYTHNTTA